MNIPFQRLIFASITTLALVLSPLGSLPVRAAAADDFVITVKTDNPGSSSTQFTIPTAGSGYNYNVDCDDNGSFEATAQTGDYTCNYGEAGTYTVRIRDNSGAGTGFPRIYFNNGGDRQKLLSIKQWGTGLWTSMNSAFYGCSNLTLAASDRPDLSNVTDLGQMFYNASAFNGAIGGWDVSHVTSMRLMFAGASAFNQPIGSWNTSQVSNMTGMFDGASAFNGAIGGWDVSHVTYMSMMFNGATSFNQPIGEWHTSQVTYMSLMFAGATSFNQPIGGWDVSHVTYMSMMFNNVTLSQTNYDALLTGWNGQALQTGVTFSGGNSLYCTGESARSHMISADGWTINDGGKGCPSSVTTGSASALTSSGATLNGTVNANGVSTVVTFEYGLTSSYGSSLPAAQSPVTGTSDTAVSAVLGGLTSNRTYHFRAVGANTGSTSYGADQTFSTSVAAADDFVITVQTDNPGTSSSNRFTIPTIATIGSSYNYNVDCDDNGSFEATAQTGNYTCTYGGAGIYTVRIRDNSGAGTGFPHIYFHNGGDRQKLLSIKQWGTGQWISMNSAFYGCSNLTLAASDSPDLSNVTDLSRMFEGASAFNQDISSWKTGQVTNMSVMFGDATSFNQPIGGWDVSHVTDMIGMFDSASAFNQPIGSWNTSQVSNMTGMFNGATSFNQPIGGWNVTQVADMSIMFNNVTLSQPNYDALLTGWNGQALQTGVTFSGGNSKYCAGESARSHLISADGWTISDGGKNCSPLVTTGSASALTASGATLNGTVNANGLSTVVTFEYGLTGSYGSSLTAAQSPVTGTGDTAVSAVLGGLTSNRTYHFRSVGVNTGGTSYGADQTFSIPLAATDDFVITVQTDNPGTSSSTRFTIPTILTIGISYNYNVDCDDNGSFEATGVTGNYTCTYGAAGTYTVRIRDNSGAGTGFPLIYFHNGGDRQKLLSIKQWGTGQWISMNSAFYGCSNLTLAASDSPDLSNVTDLSRMFEGASGFNQDISSWKTGQVTNMSVMFGGATSFNQPIGGWDVSHVTDMIGMFDSASAFNQPIGSWNTSQVSDMTGMFNGATSFNQPIDGWNVTQVADMSIMFNNVTLSQTNYDALLTGWNGQALQTGVTFSGGNSKYCAGESARSHLISADGWKISDSGKGCSSVTTGSASALTASGATLNGTVNANGLSTVVTFEYGLTGSYGSSLTAAQSPVTGTGDTAVSAALGGLTPKQTYHFRAVGVNTGGTSYGADQTFKTTPGVMDDFVITVKTDNPGSSSSTQFTIPTYGSGYNYNVDCDDNGSFEATGVTGDYPCTYGAAGTYTLRIRDNSGAGTGFPRIYFDNGGDRLKLLSIEQWGTGKWTSMVSAFAGCANLAGHASDSPDLSNVTDLSRMFEDTSSFNQPIGGWDVSHVTDMTGMFWGATSFNQPIGGWNVTQVTNMSIMFNNVTLSQTNYDTLLTGWNGQALQTGVTFSGGNSQYCAGESARSHLISADGWTISDGGKGCPSVTTGSASALTASGVTLNGTVNANGLSTVVTFEYGPTTGYGTTVTATQSPVTGASDTAVSASITGLTANQTYHYRAVGVSTGGTIYGGDQSFTTNPCSSAISVSSTADSGAGSLRQAIGDVCSGGKITFAAGLSGQTITLSSGELVIAQDMTIDGSGLAAQVTISGNHAARVVNIHSGTVTLDGLKISGGNSGTENGGGIYNLGILTVNDNTISGNSSYRGAGVYNNGTLTVNNSTFSGNSVSMGGAGIYSDNSSTLTVNNSTFLNNSALGGGGGGIISLIDTVLNVNNSTFSGNSAKLDGGGIFNFKGTLTVKNSTFSANSVGEYGGGIYSYLGPVTVDNSTFSANSATVNGGGIYNDFSSTLTFSNTILGGSPSGNDCYNQGTMGAGSTHNLLQNDAPSGHTCGTAGSTYSVVPDPGLSDLADNGGPTQTMALKADSPAIDAGDAAACTAVGNKDQRGVTRPVGSGCDMGALELDQPTPQVLLGSSVPADGAVLAAGPTSLKVVFNRDVSVATVTNVANYLLVGVGPNKDFDTQTCKAGLAADDIKYDIAGPVLYDANSYTATLNLSGGTALPNGHYRLFICGTTSITDVYGLKLNLGYSDSKLTFTVGESGAGSAGSGGGGGLASVLPETGFAPGVVTRIAEQPLSRANTDEPDLALEIPAIAVAEPVVGVPQGAGWDVSWLGSRIGYLEGTAYPSLAGNSVLAGHVTDADGKPGVFARLGSLSYGQQVILHAWGQTFTYEVRTVDEWVKPNDTRLMTRHEVLPWLTLVTCHGWDAGTHGYDWRTVVRAVLVKVAQ